MNDTAELRVSIKEIMEAGSHSLRDLQEMTGVSFSTLSRFLRGKGALTHQNFIRLQTFATGGELPVKKTINSKIVNIDGKQFRITVDLLKEQGE